MPFITQGKTNWKFLLVVVVVAVVVGGGTIWLVKKQEAQFAKLTEIKIPEKVKDETANWQTYRNEKYGYEIKYPKDWQGDFSDSSYISLSSEISAENSIDFGIEVYKDDYGSRGPMYVSCEEPEESEISGISGIKYYCNVPYWKGTEHEKPPISEITSHVIIFVLHVDENFIKLVLDCEGEEWIGESGKNNCDQLFNQILSTFRFIE